MTTYARMTAEEREYQAETNAAREHASKQEGAASRARLAPSASNGKGRSCKG